MAQSTIGVPVGTIAIFTSNSTNDLPSGWLFADGQCIDNDDYPLIEPILNDTFGTCGGDPSKTRLPAFGGRFVVGSKPLNDGHNFSFGNIGGVEYYTLLASEMPTHNHTVSIRAPQPNPGQVANGGGWYATDVGNTVSSNAGGGLEHENTPPYLAMIYIIKVLPDEQIVDTAPITSTYDINIQFADNANVSITRTLITTDVENYTGDINLPAFYKSFDTVYTIAMFMIFVLVGAAAGKPTMFTIAFIALYITGVLQRGGNYVTFPLIILAAAYLIYKFIIVRRKI